MNFTLRCTALVWRVLLQVKKMRSELGNIIIFKEARNGIKLMFSACLWGTLNEQLVTAFNDWTLFELFNLFVLHSRGCFCTSLFTCLLQWLFRIKLAKLKEYREIISFWIIFRFKSTRYLLFICYFAKPYDRSKIMYKIKLNNAFIYRVLNGNGEIFNANTRY